MGLKDAQNCSTCMRHGLASRNKDDFPANFNSCNFVNSKTRRRSVGAVKKRGFAILEHGVAAEHANHRARESPLDSSSAG
jgi:hypothetical protein